ncbi:GTP-binding protein 2-like isoform X2 [Ornithodoros turicata]|uniref:Putative translation elongation factor ef-1 alpha/tu n=2 Tax=Ornithodoros turicata TaxID=34597 RepID=A0A2R5LJD1_9ACAR
METLFGPDRGRGDSDSLLWLPPEAAEGNIEYKLKLVSPSQSRLEHLVTQMKWRLREGQGEAIYKIGVEDGGLLVGLTQHELQASLNTLYSMADKLGATLTVLRERTVSREDEVPERKAAEVLVRKVPEDQQTIEIRVAVLGSVDVGKSTVLGVLTQGELDNGRGSARLNLFRHLHEIQTGHTSSISREILGFSSQGQPVTYRHCRTTEEMCDISTKLITFIDLAGHQKYLRTTVFGLTGHSPHFVMLVVNAASGMTGTGRDHLALALALQVPLAVVVNKVDTVTTAVLARTLTQLYTFLKGPTCKKVPMEVLNEDDALTAASSMVSENVVPVFLVSCVHGDGLNLLYTFLNVLPPGHTPKERDYLMQLDPEFQIDETFQVPDVGPVAGGLLTRGVLREDDNLLAGPAHDGAFYPIRVLSVQRNRVPCRLVRAGESATLALDIGDAPPGLLRRGTVLCRQESRPTASRLFRARIRLLSHPLQLNIGFQAMVQAGNVQQMAVVVGIRGRPPSLVAGEQGVVLFKFLRHPECLRPGARLLFHQGPARGIGRVLQAFPLQVAPH